MLGRSVTITGKNCVEIIKRDSGEPAAGQVLLRADKSLISPGTERADLLQLANTKAVHKIPFVSGYSFVGMVEKVGSGVTDFQVGERVFGHLPHQEFQVASCSVLRKVPKNVDSASATFTSLGHIAIQGVRKSRLELGSSVLVIGLGLVGQLACKLARQNGAVPLIGADLSEFRRKIGSSACDAVLDPKDPSMQEKLMEITGGSGPEIVIEATGVPEVINTALNLTARMGRVVILGSSRGKTSEVDFYFPVHKRGLTIIGAHLTAGPEFEKQPNLWPKKAEEELILNMLSTKRLTVEDLITDCIPVDKAPDAYQELGQWDENMMATVLDWKN
jgi:2-desacetyl-2-hydroxyethyl bacteriochlorophyllide A dehydrogenase